MENLSMYGKPNCYEKTLALTTCKFFLPSAMARLFHSCFNLGDFLSLMCRPSFIKPLPASKHVPWNDIRADHMHLIATKVGLSDRLSLGVVCKSWASMKKEHLSDIKELPWFVLPHRPKSRRLKCLNLSQGTVECLNLPEPLRDGEFIGSTNGWLVFFKYEDDAEGAIVEEALLFLFNPVSSQLLELPSLPKTPCYQQWVSEEDGMLPDYITNIVISSNLINESTVIAATFCNSLELAICKPSDKQWTIFTGNRDLQDYANAMDRFLEIQDENGIGFYVDILFHDDTLLVLVSLRTHDADQSSHASRNRVYFLESLKVTFIYAFLDLDGEYLSSSCSECLIISNQVAGDYMAYPYLTLSVHGELLLILRWVFCEFERNLSWCETTKKIDIFKLDIDGDKVVRASRLEDIGSQVIFLARLEARAMDSTSFSGIQGNCVYFVGNSSFKKKDDEDFSYVCRESGEYNLRDCKVVRSLPSIIKSYKFQSDWFLPIY